MTEQEGLMLYRMFWILVGFPVLIIGSGVISYLTWTLLTKEEL